MLLIILVVDLQESILSFKNANWELYVFSASKGLSSKYATRKISLIQEDLANIALTLLNEASLSFGSRRSIVEYPAKEPEINAIRIDLEDVIIGPNYLIFNEALKTSEFEMPKKVTGYVLVGHNNEDGKDIMLISKTNPYPDLKKRIMSSNGESLLRTGDLLQLNKRIDCVIYDGYLYAVDSKFEKIFFLMSSTEQRIAEKLDELRETNKFTDESLELIEKSRSRRAIIDFDLANLESIDSKNEEMKILANYCNFGINSINQAEVLDEVAAKYFILLMTNKLEFIDGRAFTNLEELEIKKDKVPKQYN